MIGPMMGHPEGNLSQGFGSGSGFQISLDPDPVFKLLWIRIRFQPPDPKQKKSAESALKVIY